MRLVLLPGLHGTGLLFDPLIRALRPDLDPIACSYPAKECRAYGEIVPEVLRNLPKAEPFVLLGESYGGPLSLMVAASRPPGLVGLILCATFISCPRSWVPKRASRLVCSFPFRAARALAILNGRWNWFGSAELNALIGRALGGVDPAVMAARLREVVHVDVRAELLECPVPILYMQGSRDHVVPSSNLDRILDVRPDIRSVRVTGSHMVLQKEARESARIIEAFADEMRVFVERSMPSP